MFCGLFSDLAVSSSDQSVYYVHRQHLSGISTNAFAGLLPDAPFSISILEPAAVLNIVIHIMYDRSCTQYNPSLDNIEAALEVLIKYGVTPHLYASPSQPLYQLLLLHAPHHPINTYALAGQHSLENVTVAISAHLLAYDLSLITDGLSIKMGAVYLRRLVDLHCDRTKALKNIVMRPPGAHPPTLTCSQMSQARLTNAWAFALVDLVWSTLPGMSTNALHSMFEKAGKEITCEACWVNLRVRIQEVCWEWSQVKVCIFRVVRDDSPACVELISSLVAENNLNCHETIGRVRADWFVILFSVHCAIALMPYPLSV
ncbi:hypothetical protein V8D89_012310 [Ganoderma adspersum]